MRNILIIAAFVILGACGGFLCCNFNRAAIESKLEEETKQQLAELNQSQAVAVECDGMFATLKFEPSVAHVEQKEIASKISNRQVYLGTILKPQSGESPVVDKPIEENAVVAETLTAQPAGLVEAKPESKLVPELFVYLNRKKQLILEGRFPSSSNVSQLVSRLEKVYTENDVISMITVASNVDVLPWNRPDELILNLIGLTEDGTAAFSGAQLTMTGKAYSPAVKKGLAELATLVIASNAEIVNNIRVLRPELSKPNISGTVQSVPVEVATPVAVPVGLVLTQQVVKVFEDQAIYFRPSSSHLNDRDLAKIKVIGQTINGLDASQKLVVGGYADQTGDAETNRRLSLQRANAVKRELINLGVSQDRLIVKHFGEDNANLSQDKLWLSRRVELSLENQ